MDKNVVETNVSDQAQHALTFLMALSLFSALVALSVRTLFESLFQFGQFISLLLSLCRFVYQQGEAGCSTFSLANPCQLQA